MSRADLAATPVAWPSLKLWRRQSRSMVITFIGLPILLSTCLWSVYLRPGTGPSMGELTANLQNNLWGVEILLSVWLTMVVNLRSSGVIAGLREKGNWPLLKTTPWSASEIVRQEAQAVENGLGWPIRLVVVLRAAAVLLDTAVNGGGVFDLALRGLFLLMFCAETLISVRYNCALGLLASALSRTTARAQALSYGMQAAAFAMFFAPIWWRFLNGNSPFGGSLLAFGSGQLAFSGIVLFCILSVTQWLVISAAYSIVVRRAEAIVE